MKLCHFKVRSFTLAAALSMGLSFVSPASADVVTSWIVGSNGEGLIKLSTLGGASTSATGINDIGQVVGSSTTTGDEVHTFGDAHAFITGPDGLGMTDLGTLGRTGSYAESYATGINDSGQVVGRSTTVNYGDRAFITGPHGVGMTEFLPLAGAFSGSASGATAINDAGRVVGQIMGSFMTDDTRAFITGPNGVEKTDLSTLGGGDSYATGINNIGQVVGRSSVTEGEFHAFITGPNAVGMTDLGTLGWTGSYAESYATGINDSGQVVGNSRNADGALHAFITGPNGMGMTDLGALGGRGSFATGINDIGQVVGFFYTPVSGEQPHAFITGPNGVGMTDLNSLVSLPNGFVLTQATGINNLGQIIAISIAPIPEPATYALMLTGLGLVGFMARRKESDRLTG